jgi:hypothetical protein
MEEAPPVRFRVVLQVTFPDADRYDPSEYGDHLNALVDAIRNAKTVKCANVAMRSASTISPSEEQEDRDKGPNLDFGILTPSAGEVFGVGGYPVPPVKPRQIATVWNLLSKAERGELEQNINIAVGQVLGPYVNANAVLARTFILRVLQRAGHLRSEDNEELFRKAAVIPLERAPVKPSDLTEYAELFE